MGPMRALSFKNTTFKSVPELIKALQEKGFSLDSIGQMVDSTGAYMQQLKGGHSVAGKKILMKFYTISGGALDIVSILKGNGKSLKR
jgi:hypothetical protein